MRWANFQAYREVSNGFASSYSVAKRLQYDGMVFEFRRAGSHAQKQGQPGVCKVVAVLAVEASSVRCGFRVEGESRRAIKEPFALHTRRPIALVK